MSGQTFADVETQEQYFRYSSLGKFGVVYTLSMVIPLAASAISPTEKRGYLRSLGDGEVQFEHMTIKAWLCQASGIDIGNASSFPLAGMGITPFNFQRADRGVSMAISDNKGKNYQKSQGIQYIPSAGINTSRLNDYVPIELWAGPCYGYSMEPTYPWRAYMGINDNFEFRLRNADTSGYHRVEINLFGERYVQ